MTTVTQAGDGGGAKRPRLEPLFEVALQYRPGWRPLRPPRAGAATTHIWHMVEALQFETTDERYAWLNTVLAGWDGEFDMTTYLHHYQVYTSNDMPGVLT